MRSVNSERISIYILSTKKNPKKLQQSTEENKSYDEILGIIQGFSPAVAGKTSGLDLTECLLHGGDILSKSCSTVTIKY